MTCMTNCGDGSWCCPVTALFLAAAADLKPIYGGPEAGVSVVVRPAPCHPPGVYRDLARYSLHLPVCGGRRAPCRLPLCPTLTQPDAPINSLNGKLYMSPSGFCNIEIVEPRDPFLPVDTYAYTIIPSCVPTAHSPLRPWA